MEWGVGYEGRPTERGLGDGNVHTPAYIFPEKGSV